MKPEQNPQFQSGSRWRLAYRASVISILGREAPQVLSHGTQFYNVDRWTVRVLVKRMCEWAKANPGVAVTRTEIAQWVHEANDTPIPKRRIVIAAAPAKISLKVALALAGGGCHEAFHTKYSCRRSLTIAEVCNVIIPRWAQVADWSKLYKLLQEWNNIVEDIRIERRGNEDYPGVLQQLHNLQDFILAQERASMAKATKEMTEDTLQIVTGTFRDLGLGYDTVDQAAALASYQERNREAYEMVEIGPLRPHLDESIALSNKDDLGCLRIAMDVLVELSRLLDPNEMEEAGNGGRPCCPKCQAPGKDLVVRPLSDGHGGKVDGKGVVTCTKCGWQDIIDLQEGSGTGSIVDPDDVVNWEDTPQSLGDVDGGDSDKEENGKDLDGKDLDGTDPDEVGGKGVEGSKPTEDSDGKSVPRAGGHEWDPERAKAWEVIAENLLDVALDEQAAGLMDISSALGAAFQHIRDAEQGGLEEDERPWRPWSTDYDIVQRVEPSDHGKENDDIRSKLLVDSVRAEVAYLRTKLRILVRSVEQQSTAHGLRHGRGLSERMLVDSVASLRAGTMPQRAYYDIGERIDTSLAAVVVIDQSGSMGFSKKKLQNAARCLIALTEPLDSIGSAVMVAGFRDGYANEDGVDWSDARALGCHRYEGVCYDIFKGFDERFIAARWRFANTRGCGSTPMADGVQFGLDALSGRQEAHRALFVITDGEPNSGDNAVIRHQIKLAEAARVNVIGVGIGKDSIGVMTLFPNHVWTARIGDMPIKLVEKLTEILDFRGIGRGRPLRKTL
jgi:hypothetical protein